ERFTPDFFRREFADRPVRIRGRNYRLGEVIAMQQASSAENPAPYPCTLSDCSGLIRDVTPRFACSLPNRHTSALMPRHVFDLVNHLEIFFGGPGGEFPYLHYDMLRMHAWIAQVHGDKEFTLYERGQEELLYVNPQMPWVSTVDDLHDAARYPLLRKARRHVVALHAGEALFIPCGTWHTARCLSMNITVAFDQLESTNWSEFVSEVAFEERRNGHALRAIALRAYLGLLGAWLTLAERFGANRLADWGMRH
ncbi:MAG: cupin-like domain-containing protein, partial [Lysobacterales bacterium]